MALTVSEYLRYDAGPNAAVFSYPSAREGLPEVG